MKMINKRVPLRDLLFGLLTLQVLSFAATAQTPSTYDLQSPNGKIQLKIQTDKHISYAVLINGTSVLANSNLSIDIDHTTLGLNPTVKSTKTNAVDRWIDAPIPQKSAKIHEAYKE